MGYFKEKGQATQPLQHRATENVSLKNGRTLVSSMPRKIEKIMVDIQSVEKIKDFNLINERYTDFCCIEFLMWGAVVLI